MKSIMLIDDDPTMVLLLETLLDLEGFRAVRWEANQNTYTQIEHTLPDMILLDVNLRGENGLDILKQIRKNAAFDEIRVILSSGINYEEIALQNGADTFLQKPYMPADLITMINNQLKEA